MPLCHKYLFSLVSILTSSVRMCLRANSRTSLMARGARFSRVTLCRRAVSLIVHSRVTTLSSPDRADLGAVLPLMVDLAI